MRQRVKVKKPFSILPGLIWAMLLDLLDIMHSAFTAILSAVGVGIGLDLFVDLIQIAIAYFIFEDYRMVFGPGVADVVLPPVLDIFPSYTALYIALDSGLIK